MIKKPADYIEETHYRTRSVLIVEDMQEAIAVATKFSFLDNFCGGKVYYSPASMHLCYIPKEFFSYKELPIGEETT